MPHLLNVWPRVSRQIAEADHVLLLFDYDGTLSPIAQRPDLAVLPPRTRENLLAVHGSGRFSLGIVSGRGLADVRGMVGIPGLTYAGNHGLEIEGPAGTFIHPEANEVRPYLDSVLRNLEERLSGFQGVYLEGKGLTLSVHYRLAHEALIPQIMSGFDEVVSRSADEEWIRVTRGKQVLEVRPTVDWHKGRAIARIAQDYSPGTLPIYFGDDLTDEDGFQAVHELNGISVFVGPPRQPTRALYRVDSPSEVAQTLKLLASL
jgi:trehalose 6-phosphate phosphatase